MKPFTQLTFIFVLAFVLGACATAGHKYVDIRLSIDPPGQTTGKICLSDIEDLRKDVPPGYIGRRILTDNSQETYFVSGIRLDKTLSGAIKDYLTGKGFEIVPCKQACTTPESVAELSGSCDHTISGVVNQFECSARKKGALTHMTLDIDLILYHGDPASGRLKKVPVTLVLERTELTFTTKKLSEFINASIVDVFDKALLFDTEPATN